MKLIIGLAGQIASGKTTATDYLKEKYGASTYRFSNMLRDIADRMYIEKSRENLQKLSTVLRKNFDEELMARVMAEDVKNDNNNVIVVEGIRRPGDVVHLKDVPGFHLVHIFADVETSHKRIAQRNENIDDKGKSLEEFQKDLQGEAESKISEIGSTAKVQLDNNGTIEELHEQLDKLVEQYGSKS
jgi:dephospho-CoA kinase